MTKVAKDVTGRDGYIQAQALLYGITQIQSLPRQRQEYSDMVDMCRILRALVPPETLPSYAYSVEMHTGKQIDLHFPEGEEATASDEIYMQDYLFAMADYRKRRAEAIRKAVEKIETKTQTPSEIASAAIARASGQ
ncbi:MULTISPECIES: hypothetical protein [unclassified Chelatococcus]|uniref:hypothetical protein n=1 Tax=unclassified Chelatococcus TaxID=2638111 RepID=UPI001BCC5714|nr:MULTISPECIES: hypothetical protein [unclassified Chelatococcus]MBS7737916.1 hypothetical protein [Chelatococcus sp. HY11]MCO5079370.1 hypothetical protein [Chelatococcus sp.]